MTALQGVAPQLDPRLRSTTPATGAERPVGDTSTPPDSQGDRVEITTNISPSSDDGNRQAEAAGSDGRSPSVAQEPTAREKRETEELKAEDAKVREHERAHVAAAGQYAVGGARYQYKIGPDGNRYAVHGEVQIDASEIPDDPDATVRKMQVVRRAALAPRDPSSQDQRVAAQATRTEMEARTDLAEERATQAQPPQTTASGPTGTPTEPPLIDQFV
ncbi:MAG: putative metalloprotease CJM1_0395 family protein [Candidatus Neomarinimicrobiota bacterium]